MSQFLFIDNYSIRIHLVNQQQVRLLAKKFPPEQHDSFYSHTQRAFSKGNRSEIDGKTYVFNCKGLEKNRLEVIAYQMVIIIFRVYLVCVEANGRRFEFIEDHWQCRTSRTTC